MVRSTSYVSVAVSNTFVRCLGEDDVAFANLVRNTRRAQSAEPVIQTPVRELTLSSLFDAASASAGMAPKALPADARAGMEPPADQPATTCWQPARTWDDSQAHMLGAASGGDLRSFGTPRGMPSCKVAAYETDGTIPNGLAATSNHVGFPCRIHPDLGGSAAVYLRTPLTANSQERSKPSSALQCAPFDLAQQGSTNGRTAIQPNDRIDVQEPCCVMIRNIACKYKSGDICQVLDEAGLAGRYSDIHVPRNNAGRANLGYCFVTFNDQQALQHCMQSFQGKVFGGSRSDKVVEIAPARYTGSRGYPGSRRRFGS